ncbi:30S ribosomal protein S18 [Halarsenatibacter silvermanii]|uniref:Small ribosomal subunit protein bS18 n=1 Tax=Halarsenatibacter silvermanii TaxID=321763 RepID=A0A1G9Q4M8_9FIRM|nr:30S ribosomal protein S18 [Halarsenatibacter silvermanii]SDM05701.1 small subunit ribosomal protein S18 [Halarsenatibacter silvermanii]
MARGTNQSCYFCANDQEVDYKDSGTLNRFINDRGKIIPRRITGNCAVHQRKLTTAIKRSRQLAILPYVKD